MLKPGKLSCSEFQLNHFSLPQVSNPQSWFTCGSTAKSVCDM